MRVPTPDGRFPDFDDPFYSDVPYSKSLSTAALVAIVDKLVGGVETIMLAGSTVDHDAGPEVTPVVERAYVRELARLGKVLATKLGPAKAADVTEMGYAGFRWVVRGVPVVLTAYQEDRELPVEIFVTCVTKAMKPYIPPSLAAPVKRATRRPAVDHARGRQIRGRR